MTTTTFVEEIRDVIRRKNIHQCYGLEEFARELDATQKSTVSKVPLAKWLGALFLFIIPMLSASVSGSLLLGNRWDGVKMVLSGLLTILTVINSVFKPGQRYRQACLIGIKLQKMKTRFVEDLEELGESPDSTVVHHRLVNVYRDALEKYQERLIDLFPVEEFVVLPSDGLADKKTKKTVRPPSHPRN